ncbi:hypothetical protein HOH45_01235 [bacterium]|jgi:hypothetical protein|nr:hypothetical protein [bacterium]
MELTSVIYYLVVIFVLSIPLDLFFDWLHETNKYYNGQKEIPFIMMPAKPIRLALAWIGSFLKGFLPLYYGFQFVPAHHIIFALSIGFALHLWSPFAGFKYSGFTISFLLGIYTFFFPAMIILFPVILFLLCLITNSIALGMLITIILQFFTISLTDGAAEFYILNIAIFILVFLKWSKQIFEHFEQEPVTLYRSLLQRGSRYSRPT